MGHRDLSVGTAVRHLRDIALTCNELRLLTQALHIRSPSPSALLVLQGTARHDSTPSAAAWQGNKQLKGSDLHSAHMQALTRKRWRQVRSPGGSAWICYVDMQTLCRLNDPAPLNLRVAMSGYIVRLSVQTAWVTLPDTCCEHAVRQSLCRRQLLVRLRWLLTLAVCIFRRSPRLAGGLPSILLRLPRRLLLLLGGLLRLVGLVCSA